MLIKNLKLNGQSRFLEIAGYRQFPSHIEARVQYDEEWITNSDFTGNKFPRFHLTRLKDKWEIHYDYNPEEGRHQSKVKGEVLTNKLNCLRQLKHYVKHNNLCN